MLFNDFLLLASEYILRQTIWITSDHFFCQTEQRFTLITAGILLTPEHFTVNWQIILFLLTTDDYTPTDIARFLSPVTYIFGNFRQHSRRYQQNYLTNATPFGTRCEHVLVRVAGDAFQYAFRTRSSYAFRTRSGTRSGRVPVTNEKFTCLFFIFQRRIAL